MTQPTRASLMRPLLRDTAVALAVPTALYLFVGSPLPLRLPNPDALVVWWNSVQAEPTEVIHPVLTTLVYLVWIAWLWHAVWTATALLWVTFRLPALALPTALQRLTPAAAVQALALGSMLTTQTAHAATVSLAPKAGIVHLQHVPDSPAPMAHQAQQPLDQHTAASSRYTVQPGDSLWSIAEQQLGDGHAWQEIYRDNENIPQAAGGELTDPSAIRPGWSLTLPQAIDPTGPEITRAPTNTAVPLPRTPTRHDAPPTVTPPGTPRADTQPTPTAPVPPHAAHVAPARPNTLRQPAAPGNTATAPATARNAAPPAHPAGRAAAPTLTSTPSTPSARRAETPAVPHTVGWTFPGGYLGITLLSAIAAACTALLARRQTRPGGSASIPTTVRALASTARRAHAAATYGYLPEEQAPSATPPPLFTPHPSTPTLGVSPGLVYESAYDPENLKLLALTGPGACEAASALMLSILAADADAPPFPGLDSSDADEPRAFRVITDAVTAEELLGPVDHSDLPDWLLVAPTADTAALTAILPTASDATRPASLPAPPPKPTSTVLFTRAVSIDLARTIQATTTAPTPLAVIILSQTALETPDLQTVTRAHLASDGHVISARGPAAAQFAGLRLQTLHRDLAGEIYRVLRNARAPHQHTQQSSDPGRIDNAAPEEDDTAAHTIRLPAQTLGKQEPQPSSTEQPAAPPLTLRVLGPIEIHGPAGTIPVTGDRTAALLALLAVHPRGRTISQIVDQAWDGLDTTGTDATPIRSAIARARTLLRSACSSPDKPSGADLITAGPTGFRLNPRWITTDVAALDSIERSVRHTADPARRAELLRQAADLCRGELAEAIDDWDRDWLTTARAAYDQQATGLASELAQTNTAVGYGFPAT